MVFDDNYCIAFYELVLPIVINTIYKYIFDFVLIVVPKPISFGIHEGAGSDDVGREENKQPQGNSGRSYPG